MAALFEFLRDWTATDFVGATLLSIGIRAAIILALAAITALVLRRAPAALRHLTWTLAVVAVLALPLLTVALPAWKLAVLPATDSPVSNSPVVVAAPQTDVESAPVVPAVTPGTAVEWPTVAPEASTAVGGLGMTAVLLGVWILGAAGILLYMIAGSIGAARQVSRARPVHESEWIDVLDEIVDRMEIRRPVHLLMSPEIRVPMVWGLLRPVVLLPASAAEWDEERRRCVLAHELAHVRRWDGLTQTLAGIACALYWMNPLVWLAMRRMRLDRELACDDHVLRAARTKASSYASHLIEIARQAPLSFGAPNVALAMARRSQLEGRVLSILEERTARIAPRRFATFAVAAAVLLLVPAASFTPVERIAIADLAVVKAKPTTTQAKQPVKPIEPAAPAAAVDLVEAAKAQKALKAGKVDDRKYSKSVLSPGQAAMLRTSLLSLVSVRLNEAASQVNKVIDARPLPAIAKAGEVVEQCEFNVSGGGTLDIESSHGAIEVKTGSADRVRVEIHMTPRGQSTRDDFEYSCEQDGNLVSIEGRSTRRRDHGDTNVEVRYVATVPSNFNVSLETGGGNVEVSDLEGEVNIETGGGNIQLGTIRGTVNAESAGGNIELTGSQGDISVETAGGNLRIGNVGGMVYAATAGGSIVVDGAEGDLEVETAGGHIKLGRVSGSISAETAGGNIEVGEVAGSINAETSGGSIEARITRQPDEDSYLATSGGSITVHVANGVGLQIQADANGGKVRSDIPITTRRMDDDFLEGTINGGGPLLMLDGSQIQIKRL